MSNEVRSEEKEGSPRRRAQLPKLLISQIKKDYLEGKGSIRELAELYNVSYGALAAHCTRDNWKCHSTKVVEKVVETVAKVELDRLKRLHLHEEEMILRMQKRLKTVDKTYDQIGELVEPQDLKSLVGTESVINQVIRRNLGAEEKLNISGSLEIDVSDILSKIRESGPKTIDIDSETEECKLLLSELKAS